MIRKCFLNFQQCMKNISETIDCISCSKIALYCSFVIWKLFVCLLVSQNNHDFHNLPGNRRRWNGTNKIIRIFTYRYLSIVKWRNGPGHKKIIIQLLHSDNALITKMKTNLLNIDKVKFFYNFNYWTINLMIWWSNFLSSS